MRRMSNDTGASSDARTTSSWTGPLLALAGLPVLLTLVSTALPWSPVGINGIGLVFFAAQALLFAFSAMAVVVYVCRKAARSAGWGGLPESALTLAAALLSGVAIVAYQSHDPYRPDEAEQARRNAVGFLLEKLAPVLLGGDVAALRDGLASQAGAVAPASFLCAVRHNDGIIAAAAWPTDKDGQRKVFDTAFEAAVSLPSIQAEQRKALLLIAMDEALQSADRVRIEQRLGVGPVLSGGNWQADVTAHTPGVSCSTSTPWPLSRVFHMPRSEMAGALESLLAHGLRIDPHWDPEIDAQAPLPDAVVALLAKSGMPINEALQGAFMLAERVDGRDMSQLGEDRNPRVDDAEIARYIQALLDNGASPATKNTRGFTAFDALAQVRKSLQGASDPSLRRTALLDDLQRRLCTALPAGQPAVKSCAASGNPETR
jgi:hypothetical protein